MSAKNPQGLTDQQHKFSLIYLSDPEKNATQAYLKAYPKSSLKSAEAASSKLLRNHKVESFLEKQRALDETTAGVDREYVLNKLKEMADFGLTTRDVYSENGNIIGKKYQEGNVGAKGVELLGRHFKMFTDRVEHSGEIRHTGVLLIGAGPVDMKEWLGAVGGTQKTEVK